MTRVASTAQGPDRPFDRQADAAEPRGTFAFRALDASGGEVSGTMAASSAQEVARRLRAEGRTVLSIDRDMGAAGLSVAGRPGPTAAGRGPVVRWRGRARPRRADVAALCRHLGTMVEAGVPLSEALDAASEDGVRPEIRPFVARLADEVRGGAPLSQSLAAQAGVVPPVVVALVRAAESSGQPGAMLLRAADHLQRQERLLRQLRAAASYPVFMLATGSAIVAALLVFVLPRFAAIYAERGSVLPWPTQALLAASDLVRGHAAALGAGAAILVAAGFAARRSAAAARLADRIRFGAPVVGRLSRLAFVALSARTLSTLLSSGIHLLDAIAICRGLVPGARTDRFWSTVDGRLRNGGSLVDALREESLLPPGVVAMVAAGERSGRIPDVLGRAADFAEEDLETALKQATSMLEPVLILVFGTVLGGVAIALLLPLFGVAKVAAG
jgi:type II secretory pathway component PulF